MGIFQFVQIIWAYRLLIALFAVAAFVVGAVVVNVVPPRYEAQSRVMLDIIKPDPVTGEVLNSTFMRAYTKTQVEMLKDQNVARIVVQDLGWQRDPKLQADYRKRKDGRDLDFTSWAAEKIINGSQADVIAGSNILEISYASKSPQEAKSVADGLLKAYMDLTLETRRANARRNAGWYEEQAEKAKAALFTAESLKSAYERANGIVLQDDKTDLDSARLAALASQGASPVFSSPNMSASGSAAQLSALDAEIAEQTKVLGPNHPALQQMLARRNILSSQVAQERNSAASAAGAAMNAAQATGGLLEAQKAKVMGQRDKVERLRLMQDQVDLHRDQYNKAVARAAQLRQEADIADSGITPLASAITPTDPVFPKKGLIMGASIPLGLGLGFLLSILLELLGRRVRSAHDLGLAAAAPVLAVIVSTGAKSRRPPRWRGLQPSVTMRTPRVAGS